MKQGKKREINLEPSVDAEIGEKGPDVIVIDGPKY